MCDAILMDDSCETEGAVLDALPIPPDSAGDLEWLREELQRLRVKAESQAAENERLRHKTVSQADEIERLKELQRCPHLAGALETMARMAERGVVHYDLGGEGG